MNTARPSFNHLMRERRQRRLPSSPCVGSGKSTACAAILASFLVSRLLRSLNSDAFSFALLAASFRHSSFMNSTSTLAASTARSHTSSLTANCTPLAVGALSILRVATGADWLAIKLLVPEMGVLSPLPPHPHLIVCLVSRRFVTLVHYVQQKARLLFLSLEDWNSILISKNTNLRIEWRTSLSLHLCTQQEEEENFIES